jgi:asparagine synthase (glutamine-hydrolysing)
MCGIHLIWGKGATRDAIQHLVDASHHRGPDQSAIYSPWNGLWLGVNRLQILHPGPDADQPFWAPDGKSLLLLNGEIYNFRELRSLLVKIGSELVTQSDTEVLLHYLKHFGKAGLEKLNGMFALVYVDLLSQSVLVAVDRNGEKPLYYSKNEETLVISSEVRGIVGLRNFRPDWEQANHYYYLRSPLPGKTFYRGIRAWKPGRYTQIFRHDTFRWKTLGPPKKSELEPSQEGFHQTLEQAVESQFYTDVPVGILLSGGSDSTLLYSSWYRQTGQALPAYTAQVEKRYRVRYNDGDAASRVCKQIPAEHRLVEVDQQIFLDNWEDYLRSVDFPVGDSAGFLSWLIGKQAKSEVKVLISGAGADELWGGYQRHRAFLKYWERRDIWCRFAPILEKLPLGRERRKFMTAIVSDPHETFLNFSALQNLPPDMSEDYERIFNRDLQEYKRMLDFDRQVYLVQDVLKLHDNALMAHGIEGRSPYLDARFLALWHQVSDPRQLTGKLWIKNILRERDLAWVADRKKLGFGLPLREWLGEKSRFSNRVFDSLKLFDKSHGENFSKPVRQMLQAPERASRHQFLTVYNLFLLAEWTNLRGL